MSRASSPAFLVGNGRWGGAGCRALGGRASRCAAHVRVCNRRSAAVLRWASSLRSASPAAANEAAKVLEAAREVASRGRTSDAASRERVATLAAELERRSGGDVERLPYLELQRRTDTLWRLLYTTRPSSASAIQRLVVGSSSTFQDVYQRLELPSDGQDGRLNNIADFRGTPLRGYLSVQATITRVDDGARLRIRFDRAYLRLFGGRLRVPYPVPFRLLGAKARGWLDITYVDDRLRLSRGSRGTLFVLERVDDDGVVGHDAADF